MSPRHPEMVPFVYALIFNCLAPVLCVFGALLAFFEPRTALKSHIADPTFDIGHGLILHQRGGYMLFMAFIYAFLLASPSADVYLWNMVQTAALVTDVVCLWAIWTVLDVQRRLSPATWRWEDWLSVGTNVMMTVARILFLSGIGLEQWYESNMRRNIYGKQSKEL